MASKSYSQPPSGRELRNGYSLLPAPQNGRCITLAISGEIDLSNADAVRASIDSTVSKPHERIVFELARLEFLDSSGIALLLWAAAQAQSVQLRQPSDIVRRIIEVTGLSEILNMDE